MMFSGGLPRPSIVLSIDPGETITSSFSLVTSSLVVLFLGFDNGNDVLVESCIPLNCRYERVVGEVIGAVGGVVGIRGFVPKFFNGFAFRLQIG